jgi:hypothetical protein
MCNFIENSKILTEISKLSLPSIKFVKKIYIERNPFYDITLDLINKEIE